MKDKKLFFILLICIAIFTVGHVHKTFENDTYFTIPIGNYILEHGVNEEEPLTFHEDLKFTKLRWGFDVIVSLIYHQFGFTGLYIFTVAMAILLSCSLYTVMCKMTNLKIVPFIATIVVIIFCKSNFVCRAQIISYTIFILEIYFLYMLNETSKRKYMVYLVLLSFALLTFHSSVWIVYLIFFMPYIAEWLFNYTYQPPKLIVRKVPMKKIALTLGIVLLTGFCTPLGLSPFTYSIQSINTIASEIITELQPITIEQTPALLLALIFFLILELLTNAKWNIANLCYFFGGIMMSLIAERNLYIAIPILAIVLVQTIQNFMESQDILKVNDRIETYLNKHGYTYFVFIVAIVTYAGICYHDIVEEEYVDSGLYPVEAVQYIKENLEVEKVRAYTAFNYGSYVELEGIKAFIDSRSEIFCEEFNHVTILEDWKNFYFGTEDELEENLKNVIEKYQITHVICFAYDYFVPYMESSPQFKTLYEDNNFKVLEVQ